MKSNKFFLVLISSLLLTTVQSCKEEVSEEEEQFKPSVELSTVERKDYVHKIRVQGNVETDQDILLSSEMGGLIISIDVKEGQKVSKGQTIATIDASVLTSNMEELKTQLEYAEYMLDKQEELSKRGVGSQFDLEAAKNRVNSLNASIESLSTQRGKSVIKAPISGMIDQVFTKQGQMAGPGSPIARLVNNNEVDIVAGISEKHFAHVHVGTDMEVTFPNYSDTVIKMKVTNVGNYIEPTNRTFRIKSTLDHNTYFLPNMVAEISINDMEVNNGLVIPTAAVLKDQQNNDYIYTVLPYTEKESTSEKKNEKESKSGNENGKENKSEKLYVAKKVIVHVISRYEGDCLIREGDIEEHMPIVIKGARGIADGETIRSL